MFTMVIEEKGVQRRVTFNKNVVSVGRGAENDLDLRSGNVSRQHLRVLFQDGQFIVVDLKSANGTYVNGFKIAQATRVREEDKIYVGDFLIRVVTPQRDSLPPPPRRDLSPEPAQAGTSSAPSARTPSISRRTPDGPTGAGPARPDALTLKPPLVEPTATPPVAVPPPRPPAAVGPTQVSASGAPAAASPAEEAARPAEEWIEDVQPEDESRADAAEAEANASSSATAAAPSPASPEPPRPAPSSGVAVVGGGDRESSTDGLSPHAGPVRRATTIPPPPIEPPWSESPAQAAERVALVSLVERVSAAVGAAVLDESPPASSEHSRAVERAVAEHLAMMSEHGELTDAIDRDVLARDAMRELLGLGPLELLLHANEVREIHILHPDCVLVRTSAGVTRRERSFTSETAVARVVARLAQRSGEPRHPGEVVIERRLSRGAIMTAVAPPAASGWVVHIQKVRRLESSLGELLGAGAISDAVTAFLQTCAAARLNVLLSGPDSAAVETVLAAFASAVPDGELVAVLEPPADQLMIPGAHVVSLAVHEGGDTGTRAVQIAARLGVDRVVVTSLNGPAGAATFDLVAEGRVSVLAAVVAPSLPHGLARLVATVALARPGATVAAIREVAAHSFDVAIEVDRSGGLVGVKRIAELDGSDARGVGLQDLFTRKAGTGEASYLAAPVSAKLASRLRARASSRPDQEGASADAR